MVEIEGAERVTRANMAPAGPMNWALRAALMVLIAGGLALRLVYPSTTYFCEDQADACALVDDIVAGAWPTGGLQNSGGFRNLPGFVYLLVPARLISADPLAQSIFIAIVNVLSVLLAGALMRRWVGGPAAWWATTFLATAPWAIHYSRFVWAQNLLFPAALLVYAFLWRWVEGGRRWAACGVVLALTLLTQIHLVGIVLALAVGLYLLWARPRLPALPLLVGVGIAILSILPYLLDGHFELPVGRRFGYEHYWRVVVAGAMSVTGLGWWLAFYEGYAAFMESLAWRRWLYEGTMFIPVALLGAGLLLGLAKLWRERRAGLPARRSGLAMVVALALLIPISFNLLGLRTSPTYMQVWYPVPFALMGWTATRLTAARRWAPACVAILLLIPCVQLAFFTEQLHYMHTHGGIPGSRIGRTYGGMRCDVAALAASVDAAEVWEIYEGPAAQERAARYLLRRGPWRGTNDQRVLVRFRWWQSWDTGEGIEKIPAEDAPPEDACLIRPWPGWQQRDGRTPCRPD
jgi:hypothetical protein